MIRYKEFKIQKGHFVHHANARYALYWTLFFEGVVEGPAMLILESTYINPPPILTLALAVGLLVCLCDAGLGLGASICVGYLSLACICLASRIETHITAQRLYHQKQ